MYMIINRGNKFRIEPDGKQKALLRQYAGDNRFLWNKALALQKEMLKYGETPYAYKTLASIHVAWKKEILFLAGAPSQTLQQTLKHLDKAIKEAFDRKSPKRFPVFKKKWESRGSFVYPQGFKIDEGNSRVFLPKVGWVKYRKSKALSGEAKNITVSEKNGKWYISVMTKEEAPDPVHPMRKEEPVGMDLGVAKFAAFSDGDFIEPINALRSLEKKLARLQRDLARKKKGSKNWHKTKDKIARLHERIASIRRDYLHKASNSVSKNHAVVFAESLKIANMSRSAKGTVEEPGRNVRAKSGLNKSILDQGWGEFRRQLSYKLSWRGGLYLEVPPRDTSRTCPVCGHTAAENRKTQALFVCVECGHSANADTNAAVNIKDKGLSLYAEVLESWRRGYAVGSNACGGIRASAPVKQEPTCTA